MIISNILNFYNLKFKFNTSEFNIKINIIEFKVLKINNTKHLF